MQGYAAEVPEKGIYSPFAFFSIAKEGNILLTRKVETPCQERDDMPGAAHAVWSFHGAPPATTDALRVQLCFTRQVLETMAELLSGTPEDLDPLEQGF